MKKILSFLLIAVSFSAYAQKTDAALKTQINSQIKTVTLAPAKVGAVLDSLVDGKQSLYADPKDITGTTYTVQNWDVGKTLHATHASGTTITITNTLPANMVFNVVRDEGAGIVTFVAGGSADLQTINDALTLESNTIAVTWIKKTATVFQGFGALGTPSGGGGGTWGSITGSLPDQTDLQSALDAKQVTLVSGTNIKTVNSNSLLGSGNVSVGDAVVANPLSQFASTTSAQVASTVSDETGSTSGGLLVFNNGPVLIGPALGTPVSGVATNLTGTASGLTAGTVTTNANSNGDITSVGNTTSISAGVIVDADVNASAAIAGTKIANIPAGNIASTNVQAAINELDTDLYNAILGQRTKEATKYASTAALPSIVYSNGSSGVGATLTGVALAAISLDGNSPSLNDRVLIKNQASTFQNGIYTVTQTGSGIAVFILTRAIDFDQAADIQTGDNVFVTSGNTLSTTTWTYNAGDNPVMGTDAITFVQIAGQGSFTGGNGITITGTSIAIDPSVTVDKTTSQTLTNKTLTNAIVGTQSANDNSTKAASTAYSDAKVAEAITNGVTGIAPSEDQIFDALALKLDATATTIGAQDLFIGSVAMWPRVTGGCASLAQTEIATSLFNIQTLDFDQTTQEFAQMQFVFPRNWNHATITATVYWTAASGSGGVVWGISGGAYSDSDVMTSALGTAQTVTDTFVAANDVHITSTTSAITLAGTPQDADFIAIQISRNPADGSDTLTADAKLLGIRIVYTLDAGTSE